MRNNSSAAVAAFSPVGVLSSFPSSQAQARCNLMHEFVPKSL